MRNLRNIRYNAWPPASGDGSESVSACCWDPAKDEVLCTVGPTKEDANIRLLRFTEHVRDSSAKIEYVEVAKWEALSPNPDIPTDKVVSLHHFSESLTTILVLEGGDIVLVREPNVSEDGVHIEIMGSIDEGITAAQWAPDEELLAITTKARTIVFMSRNFEGITDGTMTPQDLKLSKQVSVGWGKKETQFEGRGAKALRDPTIPERVDHGDLSPYDDGGVSISWRGDGAYVAVNSIEPNVRRVIRVYSRDGILDSVSEAVDGMEGALSWRPAGNLIASVRRKDSGVDVIFFERNGLRHGEFALRPISDDLGISSHNIRLEWNSDSSVLAVVLDDRIQFWTSGNYHWYLKQEIIPRARPSAINWHPEKPLYLAALTEGAFHNKLILAEYIFSVSRGSLSPPNDHGAVAVIDGKTLNLTPFRTANVPPPMAMFEVAAPSTISDVAFSPANNYMAVLHQNGVELLKWQTKQQRSVQPTLLSSADATSEEGLGLIPLQVAVSDDGTIQSLQFCTERGHVVQSHSFDTKSGKLLASLDSMSPSSCGFAGHVRTRDGQGFVIQDLQGRLRRSTTDYNDSLTVKFPLLLPWTHLVDTDDGVLALGLSRHGHLYANSRQLVKNCTSFLVTPDHVIFTTTNHLLKFVHLAAVDNLEIPGDDPETDERCRSVERGARLVTTIPSSLSLVLQMPRGNLETIFPRAMVVAGIRQLIEEKQYDRAFSHCRTQRVDMNILYDHKPQQFLDNVSLFLEKLGDVTYIDLFLSSLRNEDVSQTMYRVTKNMKSQIEPPVAGTLTVSNTESKVNTICESVLASLQSRNVLYHGTLQNIITANVCQVPPALEGGLLVVAQLMQEDEKLAEGAVEHICFLADVNTLYDEALGLYDLQLALLVAQQSQRDPREYLPFVQNLHQLPELRRKFTIDDHLTRYPKALAHLQSLNAHQEAQDYTVKHVLYAQALRLYRNDAANLTAMTSLYAVYLESKSRFREAGLTYESLHDYASATRCYRAVGATSWREALFTADLQEPALSSGERAELATALADALYEAKDYVSAATIHLDHLQSLETALRCLCKGYQFADALRLAALRQCPDLFESTIDPGLADALGSSTEFLADCKAQIRAQVPRILELRRKAVEDPLAFYEGERAGGADLPDDVSIAASSRMSTSASLFTRYTGKDGSIGTAGTGVSRATSKNRKREEKKRARGRKGTVYEEEYLVSSVRRLVERVESTKGEISRLVFGLVRRNMMERARTIEALMGEVVEGCRKAIDEVFPKGRTAGGAGGGGENDAEPEGDGGEGWTPRGADAVLASSLEAAWKKAEPPVITGMEKLSILGG